MYKFITLIFLTVFAASGCRPYMEQILVEFETSEVPVLIELENENNQVASDALNGKVQTTTEEMKSYFRERLVRSQRVVIPQRWKNTGYFWLSGHYIPTVKTVVIDLQPETVRWEGNTGIWVESFDSVGFSTGITITARIESIDDGLTFLSHYPPKSTRVIETKNGTYQIHITSLEGIMDHEMKAIVQGIIAHEVAGYPMDECREKKREIIDAVRDKLIPFFAERGVTITNIGQFGGFEYENKANQEAIDKVFQAQQDKSVAIAESEAAEERKLALKLIGEGEGDKILQKQIKEAEGIKAIADAKRYEVEQAQADLETYLKLKQLEIESLRISRWDGILPRWLMGESGGMNSLLISPPTEPVNDK